jgi:[acyl-carrier-protein] S-malonyltransferase
VPSHCDLMKPAADRLLQAMQSIDFQSPQIPVINNVDVAIENTPEAIRDALYRQLFKPVRWVEVIERLGQEGVEQFIECGPGKVLSGLNKRILSDLSSESIYAILKEFSCS